MKHSVHTLVFRSLKRSHDMFLSQEGQPIPQNDQAYVTMDTHTYHYNVDTTTNIATLNIRPIIIAPFIA